MSRAAGKIQNKEAYKGDWDAYICQGGLQLHQEFAAMITMKKSNNPLVATSGYSIASHFMATFHCRVARFRPDHILTP